MQVTRWNINDAYNRAEGDAEVLAREVARIVHFVKGRVSLFVCEHGAHRSTLGVATMLVAGGSLPSQVGLLSLLLPHTLVALAMATA